MGQAKGVRDVFGEMQDCGVGRHPGPCMLESRVTSI